MRTTCIVVNVLFSYLELILALYKFTKILEFSVKYWRSEVYSHTQSDPSVPTWPPSDPPPKNQRVPYPHNLPLQGINI